MNHLSKINLFATLWSCMGRNGLSGAYRMKVANLFMLCFALVGVNPSFAELTLPYTNSFDTPTEQAAWQLTGLWEISADGVGYYLDNNPASVDQSSLDVDQEALLLEPFTVPADAVRPVVSYRYMLDVLSSDFMNVEVLPAGSTSWTYLKRYQVRDNPGGSGYVSESLDLSDYKGQTLQLRFRQDPSGGTGPRIWYINDLFIGEDPVPTELAYPYVNDFETSAEKMAWNLQGSWGVLNSQGDRISYSGAYHLDNNPTDLDQAFFRDGGQSATLKGQVSIPATAVRPVLSYWYNLGLLSSDYMYVQARTPDSADWVKLRTYRSRDNHTGYTRETIDLSDYKGQSIQLRFEQWAGSGSGPRTWLIDDLFIGEDPVLTELSYPYSNDFESPAEQAAWNLQGSWAILDSQGDRVSYREVYHLDNNPGDLDQRFYRDGGQSATLNGQVSIPADAIRPIISYRYDLELLSSDYMYVKVRTSDSSDWVNIRTYRFKDNHTGYPHEVIDLSAYKGQSIQLRFEQWAGSDSGPRTWLIDDLFIGEDPVPAELGYPYTNDFETSAEQAVWKLQSSWGFLDSQGDHTTHSGTYHLDSNPELLDQRFYYTGINATLNGQITVPANAVRPVLSYWYKLELLDNDYLYAVVRTPDSSEWVKIRTYKFKDNHTGHTRETIDLSDYKGQSIQLRFVQWMGAANGPRTWLIDDLFIGEDPVPAELGYPYANDFETSAEQAVWNLQSSWGFLDSQGEHTSHSGVYHLDSNPELVDQRFYNAGINAILEGHVSIPVDAVRPVLSYWYKLELLDNDYLYAVVRNPDSSEWVKIRTYKFKDNHTGYTRETIDLSDYKGQSIQLKFVQWMGAANGPRTWLIDDLFIGEDPVPAELGYPYANDFETSAEQAVWNLQSSWGFLDSQGDHTTHSGTYHLDSNPELLDQRFYDHWVYATLQGQVSIPAEAIQPVISYWYRLDLLDGDYMIVEVRTPDTPDWTRLRKFDSLDSNTAYVREDLDLSAYLGQSIQIRFIQMAGYNNGPRMWLIDGLRVGVSSTHDQDGDGTPDYEDTDRDGDGVPNEADAFPDNLSEWSDLDGDGIGDNSDPDRDGDGVENLSDLFPNDPAEWADLDQDGIGDNADTDRDGDGLDNSDEELIHGTDPMLFDTDGDGLRDGDEVEIHHTDPTLPDSDLDGLSDYEEVTNLHTDPNLADSDGDGLSDSEEVLTHDTNPLNEDTDGDGLNDGDEISHGTDPFQADTDGDGFSDKLEIDAGYNPIDGASIPPDLDLDGIPDVLDDDRDGDGVNNDMDAFPDDATESADLDGDGIGDNSDPDRDGDGVANDLDLFPNDPTESSDLDGDGIGDNSDPDRDGDGVNNDTDVFPNDPTESSDLDGNGIGDNSDPDRDGDGFSNEDEVAAGTDPNNALDYPDLIAPEMVLNGVSERTTEANSIDLSGSVSDENSGLDSVIAFSDQYPSVPMAVMLSGGQWSLNVPLEVGPNQITLTASDLAGNTTELIVNVERLSTDATLALVIEQPVNGSVMNQPSLVIRGILRNELPAQSQTVTVAGSPVALTPTSLTTEFRFESSTLELVEGINTFQIQAEADGQSVTSSVSVTYQPELVMPDAPVFRILSPAEGSYLAEEGFTLVGEVFAPGGLASLSLDGAAIPFTTLQGGYYSFSEAIGFAVGADSLSMLLLAEDEEGQTSQLQIDYLRDQTAPVLVLDTPLSAAPTENGVTQHPYRLRGSLSDDNLAGFDINGTPVSLLPGDLSGEYRFDVALELSPGTPMSLLLTARDQADNINQQEYILRLDASLSVSMLLPAAGTELVHSSAPIALQVAVEVSGTGAADAIAEALLVDSSGTTVASKTLTGASGLKSGEISVPALAEQYDINIVITNSTSDILAETSRSLTVRDPVVVPLALERTEPANGEVGVEPNGFIGLYFNQPIDISKLSVSLHETAQGFTYADLDEPGTPTLNARGYQLVEVNRSHEAVPGQLSLLPGDRVVAFYPDRELAYDGEVYLDVNYDGAELSHLLFHTRALPTFINGTVIDQFSQPVEGVSVSLPDLGRSTKTNRDGAFAFGYGDRYDEALPAGRYELVVNPGLKETRFGSVRRWVTIEAGRQNRLDVTRLSLLDQQTPFVPLEGRSSVNLLGGALILDLNDADLQFPDQRRRGDIHLQFTEYGQYAYPIGGDHLPHWLYTGQPAGIQVEGELRIDMAMPQLNHSYDYLPGDGSYVLMMGFDLNSRHIVPVGVGRVENYRVSSAGASHYQSLDAIGYVLQGEAAQPHLQAYADGEIDLQALLIALDRVVE